MKIIELKAENIKKLKAVEIIFKDGVTIISGKNGAGKSSVIDSIWFTLAGKDSLKDTTKPIRDGEDHADATVDLGDYIVTRNWTSNENSYLKVENKDGAKYPSPQALLDKLIGDLSFDPLEFSRLDSKAQKQTLLKLLNIDEKLTGLESKYNEIFNERTFIGRDWKATKAQLEGMEKPDEKLPEKEVNIAALTQEYSEAVENNDAIKDLEYGIKEDSEKLSRIEEEIAKLAKEKQQLYFNIEASKKARADSKLIGLTEIQAKINTAENTNRKIWAAKKYFEKKSEVEKLEKEGKAKTVALEKINIEKQALITGSKMPIEGLAVDENGVVYSGIPFAQLSSAEQLKVSLSIAMTMNPILKVIFVRDGSLLDSTNMEVMEQIASQEGYDIIIERVDETGKVGIVIEDGKVIANNYKQERLT